MMRVPRYPFGLRFKHQSKQSPDALETYIMNDRIDSENLESSIESEDQDMVEEYAKENTRLAIRGGKRAASTRGRGGSNIASFKRSGSNI